MRKATLQSGRVLYFLGHECLVRYAGLRGQDRLVAVSALAQPKPLSELFEGKLANLPERTEANILKHKTNLVAGADISANAIDVCPTMPPTECSNILQYQLLIHGDEIGFARRVRAFYEQQAKKHITQLVVEYSQKLGVEYKKIRFSDMRSRWGSANSKAHLHFNWRIIMASYPLVEYVAAHEVAHLRHMNHSKQFWQVCEDLCPKSRAKDAALRKIGNKIIQLF